MSGKVGDNVFRASGVIAAAAAGRTGTVDWITTPKVTGDSPVTGVTAKGYFLNTTAGTITINLPAGVAGSIVSVADYAATWQSNNVTVSANGSEKIGGSAIDVTLDTIGQSVTFVYVDSTQGWVNTMDSTSNVRGDAYVTATGGTPCAGATCGDYKIHTFTGPGTLCVSAGAGDIAVIDYMVVAGGGAGGSGDGGAGGAGGFRESVPSPAAWTGSPLANPGNALPVSVQGYPITVGDGGAGTATPSPSTGGNRGSNSIFSTITSAGGGGGAGGGDPSEPYGPGGSGGGGRRDSNGCGGGTGNIPVVSPIQGTDGGSPSPRPGPVAWTGSGGGGGAGVAGTGGTGGAPSTERAGNGGNGVTTCISATPTVYAGGGGGGAEGASPDCFGTGGSGGGGVGFNPGRANTAGTVNTGGGGGARANPGTGSSGGSGIVVIRYKFQ